VRLEAVYLEAGRPVSGGYNGMRLFVDDQGIDDAQSDGPRQRLIAPWMRSQIDDELRRLMRKRDGQTGMQITMVKPQN
jgi:SH3-like domain-containing protein